MRRQAVSPQGRTVRFFQSPYDRALLCVEEQRDRLFAVVRRAWAITSDEELSKRIAALASSSGKTFDEVLYWLWEKLKLEGSGALFMVNMPGAPREAEEDESASDVESLGEAYADL